MTSGPDRLTPSSWAVCRSGMDLPLQLGMVCRYGHARGVIGFTAGYIYRACLDLTYRYGSGVVYGIRS